MLLRASSPFLVKAHIWRCWSKGSAASLVSDWMVMNDRHVPWNWLDLCLFSRASPIIMLHFVEGLPRKDLQHYAFHFEGSLYQVTSIIQYRANNHFITWILDADGKYWEVLCYWAWEIEPSGFCFVIKTDFTWISFFLCSLLKVLCPSSSS